MYPRTNYEMTEEELATLLDACKPTPCIKIGSYEGSSPQENANQAWAALGKKMGFDSDTVEPAAGKGQRFFTAVPTETPEAKSEREKREANLARVRRIEVLSNEIHERQEELAALSSPSQ